MIPANLDAVRRLFASYDHLLGITPTTGASLDELRVLVASAHRTYQAARYEEAISLLPDLLKTAEAFHAKASGTDRREMLLSYGRAVRAEDPSLHQLQL